MKILSSRYKCITCFKGTGITYNGECETCYLKRYERGTKEKNKRKNENIVARRKNKTTKKRT